MSTRAIAEKIGVEAPSFYKHVRGKEESAALLAGRAVLELGTRLHAVTDSGGDAADMLERYRELALSLPNLYRLLTGGDFRREDLPEGLENWAGAPFRLAAGRDPVRGQALWAFAHGMAILEIDARYSPAGKPAPGVWEAGATAPAPQPGTG